MNPHLSFTDLVNSAAQLDLEDYEKFIAAVNKLRAQRRQSIPSRKETALLEKINRGFPTEKWLRIQYLDSKMENESLTEQEYAELSFLTEEYETFCVKRIQLLKKLALLRNVTLDEVMSQLELENGQV
jgi:hypothetical protein